MTYSLSLTGVSANSAQQPKVLTVSDANCQTIGSEQQTMQLGTAFLTKGPDGGQSLHVYDAERCIPGVLRVLRKV